MVGALRDPWFAKSIPSLIECQPSPKCTRNWYLPGLLPTFDQSCLVLRSAFLFEQMALHLGRNGQDLFDNIAIEHFFYDVDIRGAFRGGQKGGVIVSKLSDGPLLFDLKH